MDYRDNRQRWAESHQVVHFYAGQWCTFTPALTASFEACSAFTHVAARMVAEPPNGGPFHRSASGYVVTSITRSDCYRLERQLPGGICTRCRMVPFTAHRSQSAMPSKISTMPSKLPMRPTSMPGPANSCVNISIKRSTLAWVSSTTCGQETGRKRLRVSRQRINPRIWAPADPWLRAHE